MTTVAPLSGREIEAQLRASCLGLLRQDAEMTTIWPLIFLDPRKHFCINQSQTDGPPQSGRHSFLMTTWFPKC